MENTLEQWQEIKSQSQVSLDLEKNRHDEDSVLIWVLTQSIREADNQINILSNGV